MIKSPVPPSITETAFDCPHCGVLTTQNWHQLHANRVETNSRVPNIPNEEYRSRMSAQPDGDHKSTILKWIDKSLEGHIFFDKHRNSLHVYNTLGNLHISECFNCNKVAIWVSTNLIHPAQRSGASPNQDLPEDLIADFEEARTIIGFSPRGAAALMRLVIQKLCIHLGGKGRNIDADIAQLVAAGLNPLVVKALDIVRVIGNEAVHPGTMDLKDDRDTALKLFSLVNAITEQMISHPKTVQAMYEQLPAEKLTAIEARNSKASKNKPQ